jgi:hypothetical protein
MPARLRSSALTHVVGVLIVTASLARSAEILPPGHRPLPPGVHVLTEGKVVVKPGEVLQSGTIVIRDGFIAAVGAKVEVPPNARVWPMAGLTIYPGLIDCYLTLDSSNAPVSTTRTEPIAQDRALTSGSLNYFGVPGEEIDPGARGPGYQLEAVRAQNRVAQDYTPNVRTWKRCTNWDSRAPTSFQAAVCFAVARRLSIYRRPTPTTRWFALTSFRALLLRLMVRAKALTRAR